MEIWPCFKQPPKKLLLLALAGFIAQARAQGVQLITPQKQFGYLAGDLIHIEAIMTAPPDTHLVLSSLPAPGPVNPDLDLRAIHVIETLGSTSTRITIEAEYQIFLATDHVMQSDIPGYIVKFGTSQAAIPGWSFHVSPLRGVQGTTGPLPECRPDHVLAPIPTGPALTRLLASIGCTAGSAIGFAALRYGPASFGRKPPFALACREIKTLRRARAPIETGFKSLHQACAATAGHTILAADLAGFIRAHGNFAPLAADLSEFFAASHAQFFARANAGGWTWEKLVALAVALRRAERNRA